MRTRIARVALGATTLLALAATPALANHSHVKLLGNGQCVVLAEGAGEDDVVLPPSVFGHNPNVDVSPTGPAHPLHVLVHRRNPGHRQGGIERRDLSTHGAREPHGIAHRANHERHRGERLLCERLVELGAR